MTGTIFLWSLVHIGIIALPLVTGNCVLYPFGTDHTDDVFEEADDLVFGPSALSTDYVFYGTPYSNIHISVDGLISFDDPFNSYIPTTNISETPYLTAFWNDMVLTQGGKLYCRQTTDPDILQRASDDVFSAGGTITPTLAIVVTWSDVPSVGLAPERNTFQVVMVTDGTLSYVIFLYGRIQWIETWLIEDKLTVAGFSSGSPLNKTYFLPGSATTAIEDLGMRSNVGRPGVMVFRTDQDELEFPATPEVCRCDVSINGTIQTTFDHQITDVTVRKKSWTILSKWNRVRVRDDPCKYFLKAVTDTTGSIKWIEFSYGVPKNIKKFSCNAAFDLKDSGVVSIRACEPSITPTLPYEWYSADNQTHVCISGSHDSGWVVQSKTCPWALFFTPEGTDAGVTLTVGDVFKTRLTESLCRQCI